MSDFDGVHLVPRGGSSQLSSRSDVNLWSDFGTHPIISSPMAGVSGKNLVIEMANNDCLGIYHRFDTYENRRSDIRGINHALSLGAGQRFGVAIGIDNEEVELAVAKLAVNTYGASMLCVDIANGYLQKLLDYGSRLRDMFPHTHLMSGNVVTLDGANALFKAGFDMVRIGIGGGSHCTTRSITGIGRNQLTALTECLTSDAYLVSDGGIRNSGDAVKSFAAGADYVMLLAYANEADNNGWLYGMASARNHHTMQKKLKSVEGRESQIDPELKKPLKAILEDFMWGIRSGCTYLNAESYMEIRDNCDIEKD